MKSTPKLNGILLLVVVSSAFLSCREDRKETGSDEPSAGKGAAEPRKETGPEEPSAGKHVAEPEWILEDKDKWPVVVVTNEAQFDGHSQLTGGSGFFVLNDDEQVFYATAAHLLGPSGGVNPPVGPSSLDNVFVSWSVFKRNEPGPKVKLLGVAGTSPSPDDDWLLLRVSEEAKDLPGRPLKVRKDPVKVGEEIYLLGVPYSEESKAQKVYLGSVTERAFDDRFRFDVIPPVDIRGFSGAPIIDTSGMVVGVMTIWFEPKRQGDLFLEAGGQDAAAVVARLNGATR